MAIPTRKDFSRAPLGTEVGKLTSGHGQAAYNPNKIPALASLPIAVRASAMHSTKLCPNGAGFRLFAKAALATALVVLDGMACGMLALACACLTGGRGHMRRRQAGGSRPEIKCGLVAFAGSASWQRRL